jgi:hypothetical protein
LTLCAQGLLARAAGARLPRGQYAHIDMNIAAAAAEYAQLYLDLLVQFVHSAVNLGAVMLLSSRQKANPLFRCPRSHDLHFYRALDTLAPLARRSQLLSF